MNKRITILVLLAASVLMLAAALPVLAATSTLTGEITTDDPSFPVPRFNDNDCVPEDALSPYHFETFTVEVSETGDYSYTDTGYFDSDPSTVDGVIAFFPENGFNSFSPLMNCIDSADDSAVFSLTAGRYTVVVTTYLPGDTGTYVLTFDGPGTITRVFTSPSCTYPLPDGSAIYALPAGAPAFFQPNYESYTGFNIPAGTWYISEFSGDFAKLWIACEGQPVWVPVNAIAL